MHTAIVIAMGVAVLGAGLFVGHVLGGTAGMARAALYFLPAWLLGAGINMFLGVHGAGYTVRDEAPVLLVVFAVPAAVALVCWWKLPHG